MYWFYKNLYYKSSITPLDYYQVQVVILGGAIATKPELHITCTFIIILTYRCTLSIEEAQDTTAFKVGGFLFV